MESGITTPPKMRRVSENDYEIGKRVQTRLYEINEKVAINIKIVPLQKRSE